MRSRIHFCDLDPLTSGAKRFEYFVFCSSWVLDPDLFFPVLHSFLFVNLLGLALRRFTGLLTPNYTGLVVPLRFFGVRGRGGDCPFLWSDSKFVS